MQQLQLSNVAALPLLQEASQNSLQPQTSTKASSGPAPRSYRGASSPPPSSTPAVSPRNKAAVIPSSPAPQKPATTQTGAQRPSHAASGPLTPTSSDASSSTEDGNFDGEWAWDTAVPWYCKPRSMLVVVLLLASMGLVLAGLVLQVVFRDPEGLTAQYEDTYPWLYFFAAFPPLALLLRWLCWRLYTVSHDSMWVSTPRGTFSSRQAYIKVRGWLHVGCACVLTALYTLSACRLQSTQPFVRSCTSCGRSRQRWQACCSGWSTCYGSR